MGVRFAAIRTIAAQPYRKLSGMTAGFQGQRAPRVPWMWTALIVMLLALRLPSLVEPAGGDQGLYGYAGQRILAGDVLYRDMWDQKPPAIAFVYAALWRAWPSEAMVPAADLVAAAAVAWLLVVLGRRLYSTEVGAGAAVLFLLFGDPYLQRLSGIYVRAQCEPFIALAVTASLVLLTHPERTRRHLAGAGAALAAAFWLKYNAAAYGAVVLLAAWMWPRADATSARLRDVGWVAIGFAVVTSALLVYFAANGALTELRLATIDYNLRYSNETYGGWRDGLRYLFGFPIERARVDPLWFLGGLGILLIVRRVPSDRSSLVAITWLLAAILSIAINGSRSLPNYFVQANPALALAASGGLWTLADSGRVLRFAVVALLIAGVWRVGSDAPVHGWRLASLPGLVENVGYDLRYVRGQIDRPDYLRRFRGQKHDALEVESLASHLRETTHPGDHVFVFGFSGGSVLWKSQRVSSSRFFWSRPVTIGFAADRPGYGVSGLLEDLRLRPPALVALQKEEWRSSEFFMNTEPLRRWLEAGYVFDYETPVFSVWRARTGVAGRGSGVGGR